MTATLTVAQYIEFLDSSGNTLGANERFQGRFPGQTRTFNGKNYLFAPFSIAGDLSTDGTETGDYELIAPANIITGPKLWEASEGRYIVKIWNVLLVCAPPVSEDDLPEWSEVNFLSESIRVVDSYSFSDAVPSAEEEDESFAVVTLKLISPLDYVAGTAPTRRLTAAQVGPLPTSGGLTF